MADGMGARRTGTERRALGSGHRLLPAALVCAVLFLAAAEQAGAASFASLMNKGAKAYQRGDYVAAVNLFSEAEQKDPTQPEAPRSLGWSFTSLELYDDAIDAFMRAAALDDGSDALRGIALCHFGSRRYQQALMWAQRSSQKAPGDVEALTVVGYAALYTNQLPLAVGALESAVALGPSSYLDAGLADAYLGMGDYSRAKGVAARGLARRPSDSDRAHLTRWLAYADLALGDPGEARRQLGGPGIGAGMVAGHDEGLTVRWLVPNGPAARAGLRPGDIIAGFDETVFGPEDGWSAIMFDELVRRFNDGITLTLTVLRGGARLELPVVLSFEVPATASAAAPAPARESDSAPLVTFLDDEPATSTGASGGTTIVREIAGDEAYSEASLLLHGVRVEPEAVPQGAPFSITIELTVREPGVRSGNVTVEVEIAIRRGGSTLATTRFDAAVPANQGWQVGKEVPRAAGDPGTYTVDIQVRSPSRRADATATLTVLGH